MSLAVVRHGQTSWNQMRIMQGRTDIALDETGYEQARAAAQVLAEVDGWRAVVASPLKRAQQTAHEIATLLDLPVIAADPALIERSFGAAEGVGVTEAAERWPDGDYPDAEPWADVYERGARALEHWHKTGGIIAVSHGMFLRAAISALTGEDFPRLVNGQVVRLDREDERWTSEVLAQPAAIVS